jgi:hypothetical protein
MAFNQAFLIVVGQNSLQCYVISFSNTVFFVIFEQNFSVERLKSETALQPQLAKYP